MCSNLQGVFAHRSLESVLGLGTVIALGRILQIVALTLARIVSHKHTEKSPNQSEFADSVLMI